MEGLPNGPTVLLVGSSVFNPDLVPILAKKQSIGFTVDDVDVEIVGSRLFVAVFFSGVPSNPTRLPHFQLAVPLFLVRGPSCVLGRESLSPKPS